MLAICSDDWHGNRLFLVFFFSPSFCLFPFLSPSPLRIPTNTNSTSGSSNPPALPPCCHPSQKTLGLGEKNTTMTAQARGHFSGFAPLLESTLFSATDSPLLILNPLCLFYFHFPPFLNFFFFAGLSFLLNNAGGNEVLVVYYKFRSALVSINRDKQMSR